jgi:hypothetical protein
MYNMCSLTLTHSLTHTQFSIFDHDKKVNTHINTIIKKKTTVYLIKF